MIDISQILLEHFAHDKISSNCAECRHRVNFERNVNSVLHTVSHKTGKLKKPSRRQVTLKQVVLSKVNKHELADELRQR